MGLSEAQKQVYIETAKGLKGSERRLFRARVGKLLGGQRRAARVLGWQGETIAKGIGERDSGVPIKDNFVARGRQKAKEKRPNLLTDIRLLVEGQSQTDRSFESTRLSTRLSAAQVRQQVIGQKGYSDEALPSEETIRVKRNDLGYRRRRVGKSVPLKKIRRPTRYLNSWQLCLPKRKTMRVGYDGDCLQDFGQTVQLSCPQINTFWLMLITSARRRVPQRNRV